MLLVFFLSRKARPAGRCGTSRLSIVRDVFILPRQLYHDNQQDMCQPPPGLDENLIGASIPSWMTHSCVCQFFYPSSLPHRFSMSLNPSVGVFIMEEPHFFLHVIWDQSYRQKRTGGYSHCEIANTIIMRRGIIKAGLVCLHQGTEYCRQY